MTDPRISNRLHGLQQPLSRPSQPAYPATSVPSSFQHLLDAALGEQALHFSKHAVQRMQQRQIQLSPTDMTRLQQAVASAADKGARDSLILMNRTAFVVSVVNRTIITAVDQEQMRGNVFTNIDSAVILN